MHTELLEKRCNLFYERAYGLIESELERLENLEPKKAVVMSSEIKTREEFKHFASYHFDALT